MKRLLRTIVPLVALSMTLPSMAKNPEAPAHGRDGAPPAHGRSTPPPAHGKPRPTTELGSHVVRAPGLITQVPLTSGVYVSYTPVALVLVTLGGVVASYVLTGTMVSRG